MPIVYGALIEAPAGNTNPLEFKQRVLSKLNVSCIRDAYILTAPRPLNVLTSTDLDVVLNIKWQTAVNGALPFCTDIPAYTQSLDDFFKGLQDRGIRLPVCVVIENEPCNTNYYIGTADEYINLLRAAVTVCHKYGVMVADGGTTASALRNRLSLGLTMDERKAMIARVGGVTNVTGGDFSDRVLSYLKKSGVDYVNFHWYQFDIDTSDLCNAIKYVKEKSGLPAMTNEIGQCDNTTPEVVTEVIKHIRRHYALKYCIWYSGNSDTGVQAKALHDDNGELLLNGVAFYNEMTA